MTHHYSDRLVGVNGRFHDVKHRREIVACDRARFDRVSDHLGRITDGNADTHFTKIDA
jgi:hypothetical protein